VRIPSVALLILVACPKPTKVPDEDRVSSHVVAEGDVAAMHERLAHVTSARDLLIRGSLDDARAQLQWIAENEAPTMAPAAWVAHLQDLRDSAAVGAESTDRSGLASAIADTAGACGACHDSIQGGPRFEPVSVPAPDQQMARHIWAADRMWEGLVGPDAVRWVASADVLNAEVVDSSALYSGVSLEQAGAAARLHERVHALGAAGQHSGDAADRAELYGAFLAACAECHDLLGRGPR
jgi:cytochrome c553